MRLVQMTAGDQGDRIPPHQLDRPSARLRLHRPVSGVRLVGAVEKERPMQKPGDLPTAGTFHYCIEPGCLDRLFGVPVTEQHGVQADQADTLDILEPPVQAEIGPPASQTRVRDRLPGVSGVADVVIAGNRAKVHA